MIRYETNPIIFLLNNRGYTIEVEIHDGPYNNIKNWDYAGLVEVFNAGEGNGLGLKANTSAELAAAIERATQTQRPGADRVRARPRRLHQGTARMGQPRGQSQFKTPRRPGLKGPSR